MQTEASSAVVMVTEHMLCEALLPLRGVRKTRLSVHWVNADLDCSTVCCPREGAVLFVVTCSAVSTSCSSLPCGPDITS